MRGSERLTDSAVCLVADENDLDIHLERFLKQHNQITHAEQTHTRSRIRNMRSSPRWPRARMTMALRDALKDVAWLLFDQARMIDGEAPSDPAEFGKRLGAILEKAI